MDYEVTSWRGHPNTHCPFCSFATTSENATELIDGHVAAVHPVQLREQLAEEMAERQAAERAAMTKDQLIALAAELGVDVDKRQNKDEIQAAIAAAEQTTTTEAAAQAASEDA